MLEITNTDTFQDAIASNDPRDIKAAERWLTAMAAVPADERGKGHDDRWLDHRERELFKRYYALENWSAAKRIVEMSVLPTSKDGRRKRLEELTGQQYDDIVAA